jgi:hypothetical protein
LFGIPAHLEAPTIPVATIALALAIIALIVIRIIGTGRRGIRSAMTRALGAAGGSGMGAIAIVAEIVILGLNASIAGATGAPSFKAVRSAFIVLGHGSTRQLRRLRVEVVAADRLVAAHRAAVAWQETGRAFVALMAVYTERRAVAGVVRAAECGMVH